MSRMLRALRQIQKTAPSDGSPVDCPDSPCPQSPQPQIAAARPAAADSPVACSTSSATILAAPPAAEVIVCETPLPESPLPESPSESSTDSECIARVAQTLDAADAALRIELNDAAPCLISSPSGEHRRPDVAWPRPASDRHEQAYAALADALLAHDARQLLGGVWAFVGACEGDGTTEMLISLAAAAALRGSGETFLVDGDLRRPDLTRRLRFDPQVGLLEAMSATTDFRDASHATTIPRLRVLPGVPSTASFRPEKIDFGSLFAAMRDSGARTLLDGGSLSHAERIPLLRHCDGVFVVVRLGRTSRREARDAIRAIERRGGQVAGLATIEAPRRASA